MNSISNNRALGLWSLQGARHGAREKQTRTWDIACIFSLFPTIDMFSNFDTLVNEEQTLDLEIYHHEVL